MWTYIDLSGTAEYDERRRLIVRLARAREDPSRSVTARGWGSVARRLTGGFRRLWAASGGLGATAIDGQGRT